MRIRHDKTNTKKDNRKFYSELQPRLRNFEIRQKKNLVSTSCAPRIAERMQQTWLKYAEISPIDVDFPNESSIVHG